MKTDDVAALARLAGIVTWISWAVLVGQQAADAWGRDVPWIIWLGKLLPLFIFVPGMLRDRLRSYIWLCFVCLLYFITLVEHLFAQPGSALPIVGTTAVAVLFTAAMLYVRWRARALRLLNNPPPPAGVTDHE